MRASLKTHNTGTCQFQNLVISHKINKCLQLGLAACHLYNERILAHIYNLGTENIRNGNNSLSLLRCGCNLHKNSLTNYAVRRIQDLDIPYINKLRKLFHNLIKNCVISAAFWRSRKNFILHARPRNFRRASR